MKFNGLALIPIALLLAPLFWRDLKDTARQIAALALELSLRYQLRRLDPLNPNVPQIVARLATLERTVP